MSKCKKCGSVVDGENSFCSDKCSNTHGYTKSLNDDEELCCMCHKPITALCNGAMCEDNHNNYRKYVLPSKLNSGERRDKHGNNN